MSYSKITALASAVAFASNVAAHGIVTGIVADGVYYAGYSPNYQYQEVEPVVVGWSIPKDQSLGFIAPDAYATSDIICHLDATNAQTSANVTAGGTIDLQWSVWPESHKGPVIDYLAACTNGDCTTVDKTTLEFFKIDGVGLVDDTTPPGTWASDTLIANNNTWTVKIPSDIAPGNYVLRHEIIALHSANNADGAQNYPQCINLNVVGTGTEVPTGTLGEALYTATDPGIAVNIYEALTTYVVPGPALYSGAENATQNAGASATGVASSAVVSTSAPAITSSPTSTTTQAAGSVATLCSEAVAENVVGNSSARFSNGTASASRCNSKPTHTPIPFTDGANESDSVSESTATATATATTASIAAITSAPVAIAAVQTSPIATPVASATKAAASSSSTAAAVTIPAGVTLDTVLAWISSFYTKYGSKDYNSSTTMRRSHARDVLSREA